MHFENYLKSSSSVGCVTVRVGEQENPLEQGKENLSSTLYLLSCFEESNYFY
jgi:hypothetical protein